MLLCFFFLVPFLSSKTDADVVFVHGLRGGPFMTWRQQEEKTAKKKDGTDCWPKVRGHVVTWSFPKMFVDSEKPKTNWQRSTIKQTTYISALTFPKAARGKSQKLP